MSVSEYRTYNPSAAETRERRRFITAETTVTSERSLGKKNEDATFFDAESGLVALSDGASDGAAGEKMSREVMNLVRESTPRMVGKTVDQLSQAMDREIRVILKKGELVSKRLTPNGEKPAMATMILAKLIETNSGYSAVVKSVGDSRAYIRRSNGRIEKVELSEDSYLESLVDNGELSAEAAKLISEATDVTSFAGELSAHNFGSAEEITAALGTSLRDLNKNAEDLKRKNLLLFQTVTAFKAYFSLNKRNAVTQSVGANRAQMNSKDFFINTTIVTNLRPGDRLILVSDGLSDNLNEQEIDAAAVGTDFQDQLENLRDTALTRSRDQNHMRHKADDITLIGIEIPSAPIVETVSAKPPTSSAGFFRKLRGMLTRSFEATLPAEISEAQARALGLAEETKELKKAS